MKTSRLWVLSFALLACADAGAGGSDAALVEVDSWQLEDARDARGERVDVLFPEGSTPTSMRFEDGEVRLEGPCNSMHGEYRVDGPGRLIFDEFLMTTVGCNEEISAAESEILSLLGESARWSIEKGSSKRLRLQHAAGRTSTWVTE